MDRGLIDRLGLRRLIHGSSSWIDQHNSVRIIIVVTAIVLAVVSLVVSDRLVRQMSQDERVKMEVWAQATRAMATSDYQHTLNLMSQIMLQNKTIPAIMVNEQGEIISYNNIDLPRKNPHLYLYEKLQEFRDSSYPPIIIDSTPPTYIYYSDSKLLSQITIFPYVQIVVFLIILGMSSLAIYSLKRADQNSIWEGLSRETAHQLGTPISSLMAWRELLAASDTDPMVVHEMGKDIQRLEMIADRFQKIGSVPNLKPSNLGELILRTISYLQPRISPQVELVVVEPDEDNIYAQMSDPLIAWVLENLIKNAVDAMQAKGKITISYGFLGKGVYCDVADTGRGIPWRKFETIFRPGYSTRQRGWGLGLSLARRIVDDYHSGRIFVKQSELGIGTTFRITLNKAAAPLAE
ncbi:MULTISPECIES: sensor histidine kinase KdpD [unclassified Porphyromonas]|uniref:sensor histidine kinase n=1 Tax=unclassified Porphyromonas TaxID=2645799 RepID=UPI0009E0B23C|nr:MULTISPECIES: HAMP domain-containing sensor histidine kinase [unclassified Porphyromonas]